MSKETSLIYVIIITAKNYESIPPKDLVEFINENALAIVDKTFSLKKKIEIIKKATIELDVRVDCIIEQWIQNLDPLERNTPYIRTKDGVDYTLESMLHEIRNRTEHGLILERNTILLAIDLLIRNKKNFKLQYMLVLLIAYDNNDEIVGSYFDDSKNAFTNVLHEQESLVENVHISPY